MPVPIETLWEIEPHTKAKHEILRRYLGAWFGILGNNNNRIVYLDGFCGPGRYKGGEDGSPVIALKLALNRYDRQRINEVTFVFIDGRQDRISHLENEIKKLPIPQSFHISTNVNQFEDTLSGILDYLDTKGAKIAPTFAFIDPFGFKGAPYRLIQRLLKNSKTEIFINIMVDSINRFVEHPDPQITQHIIDLFGTVNVMQIIQGDGDRIQKLRDLYQVQLKKCAKFVRYFEMKDDHDRAIYYLFFATNNRLGHLKMKETFWKVDPSAGFRFSDATNPSQLVLFDVDPSFSIAIELAQKFHRLKVIVGDLKLYVEDKTPYTSSQMKKALRYLEDQGNITIESCKKSGEKRIKHTFTNDVILTFS
jgi:three-Cys-motif partner protein